VIGKERNGRKFIGDAPSVQRESIRALKSFLALMSFQKSEFTTRHKSNASKAPNLQCFAVYLQMTNN
jgi:hypothetical protein